MRVVFFGSGAFGLPTLKRLHLTCDVRCVVSQPDRPAGRKRALSPTPISEASIELGLTLERMANVNESDCMERLRAIEADAWVVIAFGQKLSPELLDGRFAINLHASLLPRWRGAAPIHHAIMAGDTHTGVSVITLDKVMDGGLVLGQQVLPILPTDTTGRLHDVLAELGPAAVQQVLEEHILEQVLATHPLVAKAANAGHPPTIDPKAANAGHPPSIDPKAANAGHPPTIDQEGGSECQHPHSADTHHLASISGTPQDPAFVTLAPRLGRSDAVIDLSGDVDTQRNKINGLSPWPGCRLVVDGVELRVLQAGPTLEGANAASGTLTPEGFLGLGNGSLQLLEVQGAGGRTMSFGTWANGRRMEASVLVGIPR